MAAVVNGSSGLAFRSDYCSRYSMNQESPRPGFKRSSIDNDAGQWLYPDKGLDNLSWPMNQDTTNWSALHNTFVNSMQDLHNNMNSRSSNSTSIPNSFQQWQINAKLPSLDVQWQMANDQGLAFDYGSILGHDFQQQRNSHNKMSSSHNSFNGPNMQLAPSNLLQRRIEGKQQAYNAAARGQSLNGNYFPQNDDGNLGPMHSGIHISNQWSIDPNLCTDEPRTNWTQDNSYALSPPRFVDSPMLQQSSDIWMQRDRVHSRQSSHEMTSPNTASSGDISQPPSLVNSSGLSLASSTSTELDFTPRDKLERSFDDMADASGQEDGTAHIAKHRRSESGISKQDTHSSTPTYATFCRDVAGATATPNPVAKKNISKVVVDKYGNFDEAAQSSNDAVAKETRHLCPFTGCDKHFSTSGHARRHSRIHASLRPFECPHIDCDATFTRRDNCSQHQKSRHRSRLTAHRLSEEDR
jgi:hypothetical protein